MKWLIALLIVTASVSGAPLTVATYNLEFYVDRPTLGVPPKSEDGKRLVRQSIRAINPDIIALQEVGTTNALQELRSSLKREGLDFPHFEYIQAADHQLHVAFLSKHAITARRPHTNENFLFQGKRFRVLRGFAEIEVAAGQERVTLITAHLKSRRQTAEADQQGIREEEAALLREKVDDFFRKQPSGKLIVLGDFNDDIGTRTLRNVIGRGKHKLIDTRPAEPNGDSMPNPNPRYEPRRIAWTHFYAKGDTYSRPDYILISPSLKDLLDPEGTYVLAIANWGAASDHRPVVARLNLPD